MSIHRSYFNKSNTIIYNSYTNTARNPIVELFYGRVDNSSSPIGYSRYIFNIDLTSLKQKIADKTISTGCTALSTFTHKLNMKNTSFFDDELLNDKTSQGRRRATSFDLILFRIPQNQTWDSGVGYDYYDFGITNLNDRSFSQRPSNWFERTTISGWSTNGIYNNQNTATGTGVNYSALTIVDIQHFEFGNEDIEFNMTHEINSVLTGSTTGVAGWGIAYYPQVENITGLTENYSVGFFSPHTQTFYEPYLETTYNDNIEDDRNNFYNGQNNSLYLYVYQNGNPINLDSLPTVDLLDSNGNGLTGFTALTTCVVTKGVYKVNINGLTSQNVPCIYSDVWKNLYIGGVSVSDVENEFVLLPSNEAFKIGSTTSQPKTYGFNISGIKQNEKILNTDIRKVNVTVKQAYTSAQVLDKIDIYYRIYVKEGANTEVQVEDWTKVNKTPDGYYFMFDTRDKIPNEYFVDVKVISDRNINTYKRELQFQIVNKM